MMQSNLDHECLCLMSAATRQVLIAWHVIDVDCVTFQDADEAAGVVADVGLEKDVFPVGYPISRSQFKIPALTPLDLQLHLDTAVWKLPPASFTLNFRGKR